ncbi:NADH dehydrogenase 1, alpha/beta subcomplex subunit 1 ndufab1/ACP [Borealophlyctis nickersoniae]|nr:NADH dehydrogenase 1, alpha/beta subcomplex subunit 1 ndufab1/ACP [Borealophlyctis nickersoniae]
MHPVTHLFQRTAITRLSPRTLLKLTPSARLVPLPTRIPTSITCTTRLYSAQPTLTPEQIQQRVLRVVREFAKGDVHQLGPSSHFMKDMGLDSLDQVELVLALEEEFNIEIPDREAEQVMTVQEAVDKIAATKGAM